MLNPAAKATAVLLFKANDLVQVLPLCLLLGAGVLLAYLLRTCKQPPLSAAGLGSPAAMDGRHDSVMSQRDTSDDIAGASEVVQRTGWQDSAAGTTDPDSKFADDRDTVLTSSSRSRDTAAYRRPVALSQRHDSSSTIPRTSTDVSLPSFKQATAAAEMRKQSGLPARSSVSAAACSSTCTSPQCTQEQSSTASISTPRPEQHKDSPRQLPEQQRPLDVLPASDQGSSSHFQQSAPATRQQSIPELGSLFVPTSWTLPPPKSLAAVSAPLTGLALDNAASHSSQEQLPSIQSLSDPNVSKALMLGDGPQQQLLASLLLQEASATAGGPKHTAAAAAADRGTTTTASSSRRSSRVESSTSAAAAEATPGHVCRAAALVATSDPPQHAKAEAEAEAAAAPPTLDLATVLSPSPHSTAGSSHTPGHVYPSTNLRESRTATAAVSVVPTPAAATRPPGSSAATPGANTPARGHDVPASPLGAAHVRPLGTCLPASPWAGSQRGLQGAGPSNLLYGAAPAATLPTTALYKSPLQHVTLSVKVPAPFSPSAASDLQSLVARHVWAGETQVAGDPQHTILHMVSIPGCIQLFLTVAQWQPDAAAGTAAATAAGEPANMHPHEQAAAPAPQTNTTGGVEPSDWLQSPFGAQGSAVGVASAPAGAPAPAWLVSAVCRGVEEFLRTHPPQPTTSTEPPAGHTATNSRGAGGAVVPAQQQQQQQGNYDGPVLLNINGSVHTLKPHPTDTGAAWVLHECSAEELAELQAGHNLAGPPAATPTATAAAASAAHMPVVQMIQHRGPTGVPATVSVLPELPVLGTPAAVPVNNPIILPAFQHSPAAAGSPPAAAAAAAAVQSVRRRRSKIRPHSAARTFVGTLAQGVAIMHESGHTSDLFAPAHAAAAGGDASAGSASSSSSDIASVYHSQPASAAVVHLCTSCRPALALPAGMWAWPLFLSTTAGAADARVRIASCGCSAQTSAVSLHGLRGSSCRVVLATAGGDVLMDTRVPVQDGEARFMAPESTAVRSSKVFYLLPPTDTGDSPTTSGTSTAAAAPAPAPAAATPAPDQLLCMLPLLHLPPEAVIELCEAARALMLQRAHLLFTQLQSQGSEQEHEPTQTVTGSYDEYTFTDSITNPSSDAFGAGASTHLGTLSLTGFLGGVGSPRAATPAGVPAAVKEHQLPIKAGVRGAAAGGVTNTSIRLGTPAEQLQAEEGASSHEGSFDIGSPSAPRLRSPLHAAAAAPTAVGSTALGHGAGSAQHMPSAPGQSTVRCGSLGHGRAPSSSCCPGAVAGRSSKAELKTGGSSGSSGSSGSNGSGSGSSAAHVSRTGLEDEPGKLNLRGRLFEGSSDVHELLNSQYLAMLADLGLLIELAETQAADGGLSSSSGASQHASMAAEVGQQLLVWFVDNACWSCCRLVLQLLLQLRVTLHLHGQLVTADSIATVPAVQQLLQGAAAAAAAAAATFPGAEVPSTQHIAQQAPGEEGVGRVAGLLGRGAHMSNANVERAGIWGHQPRQFPASPVHVHEQAYTHIRQHSVALPHPPFAASVNQGGVAAAAGAAGSSCSKTACRSCTGTGSAAANRHQLQSSSSSDASASYVSCSSDASRGAGSDVVPSARVAAASAVPAEGPSVAAAAFSHTGAPLVPTVVDAAAGRQQPGAVADAVAVHGHHSGHHSRKMSILDSASDMWTRLRRRRSKGSRQSGEAELGGASGN